MASQTPVATPPPPTIPKLNDQLLTAYLRGFALWVQTNLSAKLPSGQALPGLLLQANDTPDGAPPSVYHLQVKGSGHTMLTPLALGSGIGGTPVSGSVGVTDGSSAPAGQVGEFMTLTSGSVSLGSGAAANIVSLALTPGDWDVDGNVSLTSSDGVGSDMLASLSLTSATVGAQIGSARLLTGSSASILGSMSLPTGRLRVSVSANTTVFLVGRATFGSGTCAASGVIQARRMR